MIVFHEGLPGAGKSYEACIYHILPALKAGRHVVTNIEGINHQKFSDLSGVPLPICEMLLECISFEDVENIDERVELQKKALLEKTQKDCLAVIDEIQDLFPTDRKKLPVEWSNYISSHRHEGQDIILMGQYFGDMHTLWRRRCKRKIVFIQQTALGRNENYTWEAWEATKPEKFKLISSGGRKYESKYFGLYKSHSKGTKNTDVYADKRTVIWNKKGIKYGIPAVLVGACYGVYFLVGMFTTPPELEKQNHVQTSVTHHKPVNYNSAPPVKVSSVSKPGPVKTVEPIYEPIDAFDNLANKYKLRLSGVIQSKNKLFVEVQVLDSSFHKQDVFNADQLRDMGWSMSYSPAGLTLSKSDRQYLVRPWPVDSWGKVNEGTSKSLGAGGVTHRSGSPVARASSSQVVYLNDTTPERMVPAERRTGNRS